MKKDYTWGRTVPESGLFNILTTSKNFAKNANLLYFGCRLPPKGICISTYC